MFAAILRRDLLEEKARPAGVLLQAAGTIVQALFWALLGRGLDAGSGGDTYFSFVAIGGAVLNFLHGPLYALAGGLARERQLGTLDFFLASRRRPFSWAISFCLFPTAWSLCLTVLYLGVMALFGLPVTLVRAGLMLCVLAATLPIYYGAALACGAWTLRFRRGQPLAWALSAFSMLFGGIFIPVEKLPGWAAHFTALAPTFYPARLARSVFSGGQFDATALTALLVAGAASLLLGGLLFEWSVHWLRKTGDFGAD